MVLESFSDKFYWVYFGNDNLEELLPELKGCSYEDAMIILEAEKIRRMK